MSHTPGPWSMFRTTETVAVRSTTDLIADVPLYHSMVGMDNARLISAAPDLLAALEEMQRTFDRPGPGTYGAGCWERADAAIAKAKGGAR